MNPTVDLSYRTSKTYRSWRAAEVVAFLWSVQGDAAAKVDEDAELCCGDGGGARVAREQREEEDDKGGEWKDPRVGLFIRPDS